MDCTPNPKYGAWIAPTHTYRTSLQGTAYCRYVPHGGRYPWRGFAAAAGAPGGRRGGHATGPGQGLKSFGRHTRRQDRPKAKAEYLKIDPNARRHAQMVAAAHALAAHLQANGGDISKCPYPANWIEGEPAGLKVRRLAMSSAGRRMPPASRTGVERE